MDDLSTLSNRREKIKQRMRTYRSLPEYILEGGAFVSKWVGGRSGFETGIPSYWFNGLVIALLTFVIGWGVSMVFEHGLADNEALLLLWAGITGALALIANKVNVRLFLATFRSSPLEKIQSLEDMDDLENWLERNFGLLRPFVSGLVFGPLLGYVLYTSWLQVSGMPFHVGPFVTITLASIQAVWVVWYFYPFYVSFPARISRYHYDLYTTDPSSSEVVWQLSQLLNSILYITIAYIVYLTVGLAYFKVLSFDVASVKTALIFSLFVWAPTVLLYATGQQHISGLITRTKWGILNELQTKIETLYAEQDIPDKVTVERLQQLMDYHDRIKATPNSALNFRASLNFLNSLLLPVVAFVIANGADVAAAIRRLFNP
jgi:hypothetical protein